VAWTRAQKTLTNLIDKTRKWANDRDSVNYRWTDGEVMEEIAASYTHLQNLRRNYEFALLAPSASFSYAAEAESTALPDEFARSEIVRIEDVSDSEHPRFLVHVSLHQLQDGVTNRYRWEVLAPATETANRRLAVRPLPTGTLTLRAWYYALPITMDAGTDEMPFLEEWYELVSISAARNLLAQGREVHAGIEARYEELLSEFKRLGMRGYVGPIRLPRTTRNHTT
jgi:hypothetical protein